MMIMSENDVTKRGRPRKYGSNAERQRAYRQRKAKPAKKESEQIHRQIHSRRRKLNPNRIINATVMSGLHVFQFQEETEEMIRNVSKERKLDRARLPEWIASLKETRRNLNRFIRFLRKL
jgi:hypothetical protein